MCATFVLSDRQADRQTFAPFQGAGTQTLAVHVEHSTKKAGGTCGRLVAKQPSGRPSDASRNFETSIIVWKLTGTESGTRGKGVRHKLTGWLSATGKREEGNFKLPDLHFLFFINAAAAQWNSQADENKKKDDISSCVLETSAAKETN